MTRPTTTIVVFDPADPAHTALLPSFADIHIECIETDGAVATFVRPVERDAVLAYWNERAMDAVSEKRVIIMALAEAADEGAKQLAGCVVLYRPLGQTAPKNGCIEKLMVSPNFRRLGLAQKLMIKVEVEAKVYGQTILTLDTYAGGPAVTLYPKLGYNTLGVIPNFFVGPLDGRPLDGIFFWKQI
ncbi:acetyltransferase [Roridomyces roridus]|uniref:Acetyltransferase n=1 Tax=Roridomyces roridus TaxID=1738132 RepID=A0AAD7FY72_9AGAR|nr:acetyltransferase [Roridomyces roridus]